MVYKGHAENGAIVLDEPANLPNGAVVRIEVTAERKVGHEDLGAAFSERFADIMGKAQSLPEDAAENHDHYLYGAPRR